MLNATVPVGATAYTAHALLSGSGQLFDLDLQANERACRLAFTAINSDGAIIAHTAIGRMIPETGWDFASDVTDQGVSIAATGVHLVISLAVEASWQAWASLDFTQNYEA